MKLNKIINSEPGWSNEEDILSLEQEEYEEAEIVEATRSSLSPHKLTPERRQQQQQQQHSLTPPRRPHPHPHARQKKSKNNIIVVHI